MKGAFTRLDKEKEAERKKKKKKVVAIPTIKKKKRGLKRHVEELNIQVIGVRKTSKDEVLNKGVYNDTYLKSVAKNRVVVKLQPLPKGQPYEEPKSFLEKGQDLLNKLIWG